VIEGTRGSYVFRLDSLFPEGVPALAAIRPRVVAAARYEKKKVVARTRAQEMSAALHDAPDILAAGRARGFPVQKLGPFTRVTAPPAFARDPFALGAAFGLRPGEKTGFLVGETWCGMMQGIAHASADSAAWLKQRDRQREALLRPVAQARVQQYLAALRAEAKVVDRRKELTRATAASGG
jgi:peptidylprolyl isomerase/peptidyl-prolyl cis-trans isomerase D